MLKINHIEFWTIYTKFFFEWGKFLFNITSKFFVLENIDSKQEYEGEYEDEYEDEYEYYDGSGSGEEEEEITYYSGSYLILNFYQANNNIHRWRCWRRCCKRCCRRC